MILRWLPWVIVAALLAALGASLWRPDAFARRMGLGEQVAERQRERWQADLRDHQQRIDQSMPAGAVLFVGDSYVQGFNASLVRACAANVGIGGETARQLAGRLASFSSLDRTAAIVVMTGANDLVRGDDATLADSYSRVLSALPADRPVLLSSLPRLIPGSARAFPAVNASGMARAACAGRPNCRFVDLAAAMSDPAAMLEADGLHLNPAGYALWARLLREALDAAGVPDRSCAG